MDPGNIQRRYRIQNDDTPSLVCFFFQRGGTAGSIVVVTDECWEIYAKYLSCSYTHVQPRLIKKFSYLTTTAESKPDPTEKLDSS